MTLTILDRFLPSFHNIPSRLMGCEQSHEHETHLDREIERKFHVERLRKLKEKEAIVTVPLMGSRGSGKTTLTAQLQLSLDFLAQFPMTTTTTTPLVLSQFQEWQDSQKTKTLQRKKNKMQTLGASITQSARSAFKFQSDFTPSSLPSEGLLTQSERVPLSALFEKGETLRQKAERSPVRSLNQSSETPPKMIDSAEELGPNEHGFRFTTSARSIGNAFPRLSSSGKSNSRTKSSSVALTEHYYDLEGSPTSLSLERCRTEQKFCVHNSFWKDNPLSNTPITSLLSSQLPESSRNQILSHYSSQVRSSLLRSIRNILLIAKQLNQPWQQEEDAQFILNFDPYDLKRPEYLVLLSQSIKRLSKTNMFNYIRLRKETIRTQFPAHFVNENLEYFIEHLDRIRSGSYEASILDILLCKNPTLSIEELELNLSSLAILPSKHNNIRPLTRTPSRRQALSIKTPILIGAKEIVPHLNIIEVPSSLLSKTNKFMSYFEGVDYLLYVCSLADFDIFDAIHCQTGETLATTALSAAAKGATDLEPNFDESEVVYQNRLFHSLATFRAIIEKWFSQQPIILLLSKVDLFREKLESVDLSVCFPEYQPPFIKSETNVERENFAIDYIKSKFRFEYNQAMRQSRKKSPAMQDLTSKSKLIVYEICNLDSFSVLNTFRQLKDEVFSVSRSNDSGS